MPLIPRQPRSTTRRTANAARKNGGGAASTTPPKPGRISIPRREDFGNFFAAELTLDTLNRVFRGALAGEAADVSTLYDKMLQRDAHIRAESRKCFAAVRGLKWEILPASPLDDDDDEFNEDLANEIAGYCRRVTRRMEGLDEALNHLILARGTGLMVAELEWETVEGKRTPVAAHTVPFANLRFDASEPWRLRIVTAGETQGVYADQFADGKFICAAPELMSGNPLVGGLYFASLLWYMFKVWDVRFLMTALELFGQPYRTVTYRESAGDDEKRELLRMLTEMGQTAGGIFPEGTTFELHASGISNSQSQWPQERVLELFNKEITKLWTGGTLTTAMDKAGGSQAAATVHADRLEEFRDEVIEAESQWMERDLYSPFVRYQFGEEAAAYVPTFRRVVEEAKDIEAMGRAFSISVNDLGAPIPMRVIEDELGHPLVEGTDREAPLPGRRAGSGLEEGFDGDDVRRSENRRALRKTSNRALDKILSRRSPLASIGPWLIGAILASQTVTERIVDAFDVALAPFNDVTLPAAATALPAEMADALAQAFADVSEGEPNSDMAELNRQLLLATRLHGERQSQVKAAAARSRNARTINAERIEFGRLPFVEAIESLRDRVGLDPETFIELDADARSRAFRVAGVWNMDLLAVLHTNLVRTLANGETVRDFRLRVLPEMTDRAGWTGENPWHSNVVFYQNFAMAHAAGRFRQYEELEISYWRFTAHGDTCPICTPQVGKVYRTTDTRYVPPLHFFCDCIDEVVFDEELVPGELRDSANDPNPALAKYHEQPSAFKFNVRQYAALEPIRIDKYPAEFRPAFKRLAESRNWQTLEDGTEPQTPPPAPEAPAVVSAPEPATPESDRHERLPAPDAAAWKEEIGKAGTEALRDYKGLLYFNDLIAMQKRGEDFAYQQLIDKLGRGQAKNIRKKIDRVKEILDGLDLAWSKRPIDSPQTVYRGISNLTAEQARQIAQGGEIQWRSWTSTSRSQAIAEMFGRYNPLLASDREWVQFKIQSRTGMPLETEGFLAREQEVLQRHGTRLRVVAATRVATEAGRPGWEVTLQEV